MRFFVLLFVLGCVLAGVAGRPQVVFDGQELAESFGQTQAHLFAAADTVSNTAEFDILQSGCGTSPNGYDNPVLTDCGYPDGRIWDDARGVGKFNDYGRWVGPGLGFPGRWYSVALEGCPRQNTMPNEFLLRNSRIVPGPKFSSYCGESPHGYTNPVLTDWGHPTDRKWLDLQVSGRRNDYGRWVGPGLGFPFEWYSVALEGCRSQNTAPGEFILDQGRVVKGPTFSGFCVHG